MATDLPADAAEIARRIEARMARARVSRRDLASRTGIPFATLDRKLDAVQELTFAELHAISACLGTNPSAFIPSAQP
ncbi:helix-turn-helix domain-containing protein [Protaetiibacter mangrovi]|uniref:Helix-turn-helix transcriptional regulator n=1 Tax=Protaetiibacter mangrovi TaxID=2970926 RepID=A0ABT1ZIR0_9MICO|nr:helix-turn-helix transcriptional regulator [Protaetiibacter mangrovi]MCS0500609.1 helix-turn-helix transcriptional regulator [Protaetiibacter mangrovi]TPX05415.1 helix-turn-helix transcriptional regulator [Schumannella luteola]